MKFHFFRYRTINSEKLLSGISRKNMEEDHSSREALLLDRLERQGRMMEQQEAMISQLLTTVQRLTGQEPRRAEEPMPSPKPKRRREKSPTNQPPKKKQKKKNDELITRSPILKPPAQDINGMSVLKIDVEGVPKIAKLKETKILNRSSKTYSKEENRETKTITYRWLPRADDLRTPANLENNILIQDNIDPPSVEFPLWTTIKGKKVKTMKQIIKFRGQQSEMTPFQAHITHGDAKWEYQLGGRTRDACFMALLLVDENLETSEFKAIRFSFRLTGGYDKADGIKPFNQLVNIKMNIGDILVEDNIERAYINFSKIWATKLAEALHTATINQLNFMNYEEDDNGDQIYIQEKAKFDPLDTISTFWTSLFV